MRGSTSRAKQSIAQPLTSIPNQLPSGVDDTRKRGGEAQASRSFVTSTISPDRYLSAYEDKPGDDKMSRFTRFLGQSLQTAVADELGRKHEAVTDAYGRMVRQTAHKGGPQPHA